MNDEYNENIAELVYLFVDGEATETEKETLFTALPDNTWLQKELQSAIAMANAARAEYADATLPEAVETSIMAKAGFAVIASDSAVQANHSFKAAGISIFNRFIVPLLSGLFGALLTYFLFWWDNSPDATIEPLVKVSANAAGIGYHDFEKGNITGTVNNQSIGLLYKGNKNDFNYNDKNTIAQQEPRVNDLKRSEQNNTIYFPDVTESNSINYIPQAFIDVPLSSAINNNFLNNKLAIDVSDYDFWEHISLQASGISGIALFPSRSANINYLPDVNNLSLEIKYNFNDNIYAGIAAGIETFPIYIENQANQLVYSTSVKWTGVTAGYSFGSILNENVKPYTKILAGGSVSGPIMKAGAGVSWQPEDIIQVNIGIEGTSQLYKYHGVWKSGEKISLVYGLEINF
jgi:hypothetical protein